MESTVNASKIKNWNYQELDLSITLIWSLFIAYVDYIYIFIYYILYVSK